jgi:hypothetical protein
MCRRKIELKLGKRLDFLKRDSKYIEPRSDSNKLLRCMGAEISKNLRLLNFITSRKSAN